MRSISELRRVLEDDIKESLAILFFRKIVTRGKRG